MCGSQISRAYLAGSKQELLSRRASLYIACLEERPGLSTGLWGSERAGERDA